MARKKSQPSKATFREAAKSKAVKHTRAKFGKKRAAKQIAAIAFSKARRRKGKKG